MVKEIEPKMLLLLNVETILENNCINYYRGILKESIDKKVTVTVRSYKVHVIKLK